MEKEKAYENFINMIENSWTYNRLTLEEKARLKEIFNHNMISRAIIGTYKQRWNILNAIYYSFLVALDYKAIGWREEDTPKF